MGPQTGTWGTLRRLTRLKHRPQASRHFPLGKLRQFPSFSVFKTPASCLVNSRAQAALSHSIAQLRCETIPPRLNSLSPGVWEGFDLGKPAVGQTRSNATL